MPGVTLCDRGRGRLSKCDVRI